MAHRLSKTTCGLISFGILILSIIVVFVAGTNGLGPIDDHQFIRTIFQGKSFGFYILPSLGRFFPLTAQEFVLISKITKPTPELFHILNATKVLLVGLLLLHCLIITKSRNIVIAAIWLAVMLSIGLANSAIRLHIGELNALILTLVFVRSILALPIDTAAISKRIQAATAIGLIALSIALFYKELIFIFSFAFSTFEIARAYRQKKQIPRHLWVLLGTAICYLIFYILWHQIYASGSYTNFHARAVLQVAQDYFTNDPFIALIATPLTLLRVVVCGKNAAKHTVFDSMLMAATAYFAAYLVLGIFNTYYLLPAYGFAACGVAGIMPYLGKNLKYLTLGTLFLFTVNNSPIAVSDMQTLRLISNNHYQFVEFLSEWILHHPLPNSAPRNLILAGVSPGSGVEILVSLKTFLVSFGVPESTIDIKTTEPSDNKTISDFHRMKTDSGSEIKINDLIIFNPYQQIFIPPPIQSPSYREIYCSDNSWSVPRWTTRHWIKFCLMYRPSLKVKLANNMRYAGYTTMLATRTVELESNAQPLKSPAYQFETSNFPSHIHAGTIMNLDVNIQNIGTETWPADGTLRPGMLVHLAYRWLDQDNQIILEGDRTPLPEPIRPNDSVKIPLEVKTPLHPGKYKLAIAPVQEGVSWFKAPREIELEFF